MTAPFAWYDDWATLYAVMSHAVDTGELTTAQQIIEVLEKPYHWNELYETWEKETADE